MSKSRCVYCQTQMIHKHQSGGPQHAKTTKVNNSVHTQTQKVVLLPSHIIRCISFSTKISAHQSLLQPSYKFAGRMASMTQKIKRGRHPRSSLTKSWLTNLIPNGDCLRRLTIRDCMQKLVCLII